MTTFLCDWYIYNKTKYMKHILNDISTDEKKSILEQHSGGKKIDTTNFKRLLESKLGEVKPYLMEQEQTGTTEDVTTKVKELSTEIGDNIDDDVANEALSCSFDEIGSGINLKPEAKEILDNVRTKIKELVSKKDKQGLKFAFRKLKSQLTKSKNQQGEVNEQAALMGAFVLFGISAPLWIWVAIGAVVLVLLIKGIVSLTSWIPKSKGRGCSRKVRYRVR